MSADLRREVDELRSEVRALRAARTGRVRSGRWVQWARRARPLVLLLTLVIGVPLVLASDRFADVPDAPPHHDDIGTLADSGISVGCGADVDGNPLYCPADPVRRDQMASFLVRGLGRVGLGYGDVAFAAGEAAWGVEITVGAPATALAATGYIKGDAQVQVLSTDSNPCTVLLDLYLLEDDTWLTPYSAVVNLPAGGSVLAPLTGAVAVGGSGTRTVAVLAWNAFDDVDDTTCAGSIQGNVTALFVPFANTGSATFGAEATPEKPARP